MLTLDTDIAILSVRPSVTFRHRNAGLLAYFLQRVQNALAKITVPQNSFSLRSTTSLLHWLPIDSCISFKLSTITLKALGSGRPPYLASLLHNCNPLRTMRSSSAKLLTVPRHIFHSAYVLCAFLLSRPGTRSNRMSVNVHLLPVFGITSKHTVSVLPSPPSDT